MAKGATAMVDTVTRTPQRGLIPIIVPIDFANLQSHPSSKLGQADKYERKALAASIKKNGIRVGDQLVLRRVNGVWTIGDGNNRKTCGDDAGHAWTNADFLEFVGTDAEFEEFVRDRNTRRHETPEERERRTRELVKLHMHWPLRKLADMARVSHTKIAQIKKEIEDEGKEKVADSKRYDALVKAWDAAEFEDQAKFAKTYRVDIEDMFGEV